MKALNDVSRKRDIKEITKRSGSMIQQPYTPGHGFFGVTKGELSGE